MTIKRDVDLKMRKGEGVLIYANGAKRRKWYLFTPILIITFPGGGEKLKAHSRKGDASNFRILLIKMFLYI